MTAYLLSESTIRDASIALPSRVDALNANWVELHDGRRTDLSTMSFEELTQLQCEQEPAFAEKITATLKGSSKRAEVIRHAYETVCAILDEMSRRGQVGKSLSMGMDSRYTRFVLDQLLWLHRQGIQGGVFELGFGAGIFLEAAAKAGYRVGGLEVTSQLFEEAKLKLPVSQHRNLCFGDFGSIDFGDQNNSYSLAYWNDVFEHVPVDEISDYLSKLHGLLKPGGKLITITPNWHMRPSDVTSLLKARRSEAIGFHLKEYTLGEVQHLLLQTGFQKVETPLFIGPKRFYFSSPCDMTRAKVFLEPALELFPAWISMQVCRRFGLNCTIATKGE